MRVILTGLVMGPSIMLLSSALLALVALKMGNPAGSVFPMALLAVFLGGFFSSMRAAKIYTEKPLQAGLLTGLAILGIITVVSLISSSYSGGVWNVLLPPAVLAVSSLAGTMAASKMKPSTKRKLKKLRKQVR